MPGALATSKVGVDVRNLKKDEKFDNVLSWNRFEYCRAFATFSNGQKIKSISIFNVNVLQIPMHL